MLTRLVIHDVVLIEKLVLEFGRGLHVFTGETGAGKSILLDALSLALGSRSEPGLIRTGAHQASITAEFTLAPHHSLFTLAEEHGLSASNPLVLRRLIGRDGKSRAFINDQPISIGILKQFGEQLLEIHGQFETHGLLNPASHRGLVDAFGSPAALVQSTRDAYAFWQEAEQKLKQSEADLEQAKNEEAFLRTAVDELEALAPKTGEADELNLRRSILQHRDKINEILNQTDQNLNSDRGAILQLAQAGKAIARMVDKAPHLKKLLESIDRASHETALASQELEKMMNTLEQQGETLEELEERLYALRSHARKHNCTVDELPQMLEKLKDRLAILSGEANTLEALSKITRDAKHNFIKAAQELSRIRKESIQKLERAINLELPPLKFDRAKFSVERNDVPESGWSGDGVDQITFLAVTNPGAPPGPLHKIASGGELARFMLALKVVLAASDPVPTLVFDEVDAGISGATASAVGERLSHLAAHVQILVVTHSPQVAARGHCHFKVLKETTKDVAVTEVEILDAPARREEIARMLAGSHVTNAAREAAQSLLDDNLTSTPMKKSKQVRV